MKPTDTHRVVYRQKSGKYEVRTVTKRQVRYWYITFLLFSGTEEECIEHAEELNEKFNYT